MGEEIVESSLVYTMYGLLARGAVFLSRVPHNGGLTTALYYMKRYSFFCIRLLNPIQMERELSCLKSLRVELIWVLF